MEQKVLLAEVNYKELDTEKYVSLMNHDNDLIILHMSFPRFYNDSLKRLEFKIAEDKLMKKSKYPF